jgi:hypothetical protein
MLELAPAVARICDQVCGILLSKDVKRFLKSTLLDEAMASQVSA